MDNKPPKAPPLPSMSVRQARALAKLRELGDPKLNLDEAEAKAAREKYIDLLYQCGALHDEVHLDVRGDITEEELREALQELCPNIDTRWLRITMEPNVNEPPLLPRRPVLELPDRSRGRQRQPHE